MLTPQDLQEVGFQTAKFGGYAKAEVDAFLEPLMDDYVALYKENAVVMDWDAPMAAFGGLTGYEVAVNMYAFHTSQQNAGQKNEKGVFEVFRVEDRESDYSCYRFGLAFSAVGEDVYKNDFFENIPE